MPIGIYMDVHVPRAITVGLQLRGIDVLTAQDDGMSEAADSDLLDRSTELGRIFFTHDNDFLKEAKRRLEAEVYFTSVVFAHQLKAPVGRCISDLELIARALDSEELGNRIDHIPF